MKRAISICAGLAFTLSVSAFAISEVGSAESAPARPNGPQLRTGYLPDTDRLPDVLLQAAEKGDRLPDAIVEGLPNSALDPATSRLIANDGQFLYYASLNAKKDVCLLAIYHADVPKEASTSVTCIASKYFNSAGLPLVSAGSWGTSVAVLVRDEFATGGISEGSKLEGAGQTIERNLIHREWRAGGAPPEGSVDATTPDGSVALHISVKGDPLVLTGSGAPIEPGQPVEGR